MDENTKIAVLGCGNMGGALVRGLVTRSGIDPTRLVACDKDEAKVQALKEELGVVAAASAKEACRDAGVIVVAVKPHGVLPLVGEIVSELAATALAGNKPLLISIAAGIAYDDLAGVCGSVGEVVRVMPNLPCTVGAGVAAVYSKNLPARETVLKLFSSVGKAVSVEKEDELNVVTALTGSGPAFIFMACEALADGAVQMGLNRGLAQMLAAEMILGSASLLVQSGEHPARLKDMVTSPRGTTIEGLAVLEACAFRSALIGAVEAACERSREIMEQG